MMRTFYLNLSQSIKWKEMKYFEIITVISAKPWLTLGKYVSEYEQIWKEMVEFLSKFQASGIKIDRVNSIRAAKQLIFFNSSRAVAC